MTLTEQKTVGEIARETPLTVRVFEKYGIDFCCGGKRPLDQACREKNIPVAEVLREIDVVSQEKSAPTGDWNTASLTSLVDHIIETHHEYLKQNLPVMRARLHKVLGAHGERHGDVLQTLAQVFDGLHDELDQHLMKEERILFPVIMHYESAKNYGAAPYRPPFGTVMHPIAMMEHEHDSAGAALAEMRKLTGDYTVPDDACNTFRALYAELEELERDLHLHIHLENNILFPRASRLEEELH